MKRRWYAFWSLCLVVLIGRAFASEGDEIYSLMGMSHSMIPSAPLIYRAELLTKTTVETGENLRPPADPRRVLGEILVGGAGGFVLGVLTGAVGLAYGEKLGFQPYEDSISLEGGLIMGSLGAVAGSSLGVYLIGNIGDETGLYATTLGGTVLGAVIFGLWGIGLDLVTRDRGYGYGLELGSEALIGAWIGIPIGETIVFNVTRRYKSSPAPKTALIHLSDGRIHFAAPTIYFRRDFYTQDAPTPRVDLVVVDF